MKKFLLFAAAAVIAVSANAQVSKKQFNSKPVAKKQVEQLSQAKKYQVAGAKFGVAPAMDKTFKQFRQLSTKELKSLKPVKRAFKSARAGEVQEQYKGYGTHRKDNTDTDWTVYTGTSTKDASVTLIQDVIPDIFGFGGIVVPYTLSEGKIVIAPQLIASFPDENAPTGTYYLFLEDASSSDGYIRLTLDDDGNITGKYSIIYSIYPAETYNYNDWVATYDGFQNIQYTVPGKEVAPEVSFEPSSLVLFAGLGLNGYSFNNNLAIAGAYTTTSFVNRTSDVATAWNWSAYDASSEAEAFFASGTDKNFNLVLNGDDVVKNITLVGTNGSKVSDPFVFGIGKSKDDGGAPRYTNSYLYASGGANNFLLNDETPAIMTRQDPDGDLTFYTNWATPDKASNSMSKIYIYHEKPSAPLYITGVTLPLVGFSAQEDFNLHIKIVKCSFTSATSKPTLGEVIAEGDATSENINAEFDSGLTAIEIPLYRTDEDGLSEDLDHLFINDEFIIVIEGWDNGTFSGALGSQDAPLDNARTSTWFEKTGEEGSMYAYTSWKTSLFVGLLDATYGYLYTTDDTHMVIPEAGGQVSINVHPMYSYSDAGAEQLGYKTRLWLDETVAGNEIPDWLQLGWINEDYDENFTFDLVAQADALPEGVEGREATIVLYQEGAQLTITVTQGKSTGINVTTKTVKTSNTPMFNLAGQRVNKDFKGLIVKDGRKMINK